jgi:hypothetical protein
MARRAFDTSTNEDRMITHLINNEVNFSGLNGNQTAYKLMQIGMSFFVDKLHVPIVEEQARQSQEQTDEEKMDVLVQRGDI